MSDYGRQITFFGKSLLQLSAQTNKQGLPTLTLELTTSEAGWDQKLVYQIEPVFELLDIAHFLCQKRIDQVHLELKPKLETPKVLTFKYNQADRDSKGNIDGTLFVGIYDNKKGSKYSKVLGIKQMFVLRSMVLSRVASLYECNISDVLKMMALDSYLNSSS